MSWGGANPGPPDRFNLVKQFDAMRSGQGGGGGMPSSDIYKPPATATVDRNPPPNAAPSSGDFSNSGYRGQASGKIVGKLGTYGNYQFDEGFLPYVQNLTKAFPGLRVSSGYRDPERNAAANGVKNSYHLKGAAMDLSGSAKDMQAAAGWAHAQGLRTLIHNAGSGMHLHVSF